MCKFICTGVCSALHCVTVCMLYLQVSLLCLKKTDIVFLLMSLCGEDPALPMLPAYK